MYLLIAQEFPIETTGAVAAQYIIDLCRSVCWREQEEEPEMDYKPSSAHEWIGVEIILPVSAVWPLWAKRVGDRECLAMRQPESYRGRRASDINHGNRALHLVMARAVEQIAQGDSAYALSGEVRSEAGG